jgi:hypothetical protein
LYFVQVRVKRSPPTEVVGVFVAFSCHRWEAWVEALAMKVRRSIEYQ